MVGVEPRERFARRTLAAGYGPRWATRGAWYLMMRRHDPLSPAERSERMSRVRAKDSKPELVVRRLVHRLGYRYRLHSKDLPGSPDLVFRTRRKAIFVHGCFWHQHGCRQYRMPRSRSDFWEPKLQKNVQRDAAAQEGLGLMGWEYLVIWECELRDLPEIENRVVEFLGKR